MNAAGWRGPAGMTNGSTVSPVRSEPTLRSHRRFDASSPYAWYPSRIVPKTRATSVGRISTSSPFQSTIPGCAIAVPRSSRMSPARRAGTAWRFNAWGGKVPDYAENARLARRVLNVAGAPSYQSSLCLEGGAVHTDGEGTIITTESVVLNPNRNPGISKRAAERELCEALGASRIIWLPGDPKGSLRRYHGWSHRWVALLT